MKLHAVRQVLNSQAITSSSYSYQIWVMLLASCVTQNNLKYNVQFVYAVSTYNIAEYNHYWQLQYWWKCVQQNTVQEEIQYYTWNTIRNAVKESYSKHIWNNVCFNEGKKIMPTVQWWHFKYSSAIFYKLKTLHTKQSRESCHSSSCQLPTSCCESLGSIPRQSMWSLWLWQRHRNTFFLMYFRLPVTIIYAMLCIHILDIYHQCYSLSNQNNH